MKLNISLDQLKKDICQERNQNWEEYWKTREINNLDDLNKSRLLFACFAISQYPNDTFIWKTWTKTDLENSIQDQDHLYVSIFERFAPKKLWEEVIIDWGHICNDVVNNIIESWKTLASISKAYCKYDIGCPINLGMYFQNDYLYTERVFNNHHLVNILSRLNFSWDKNELTKLVQNQNIRDNPFTMTQITFLYKNIKNEP